MTRRITVATIASAAAIGLACVSTADAGPSAKTYKATLTAVKPAAAMAGVPKVAGRAELVDGKRRNTISLHMRRLAPSTTYLWHVHEGTCAATGAPVAGWTYRTQTGANGTLTSDSSGVANTNGRSKSFNAGSGKRYSVNVHVAADTNGVAAGTIIACGDLKRSRSKRS
jgi:hypothetical protein